MTSVALPTLEWNPTAASGHRHGHAIARVVAHRWGDRYVNEKQEAGVYHGVVNYFKDKKNGASAHIVFPGSAVPGEATQMVSWSDYAWTQAAYNPGSVEVEAADAIFVGHDVAGMATLARILAFLLATGGGLYAPFKRPLPPVWSHERGLCRHADLGAAGGGHTQCPTTDLAQWRHLVKLTQNEYHLAASGAKPFRQTWGR